jgi:hypothetical protein
LEVVGPILARRAVVPDEEDDDVLRMLSWFSTTERTMSDVDGENKTSQIGC